MYKHLKIFTCYFRMNLASALEYRASFFTQVFGMILSNSSFIFFWSIAFEQIGNSIAGYTFMDVIFIWAVTSTGFGLGNILFANTNNLTRMVVSGELDTILLQPCNILLNLICARTKLSSYGDFIYGLVIMGIFYKTNIWAWLWFSFGSFICGILLTAITLVAHSLSFYWGEASIIGQLVSEFTLNFSVYPDKIYGPIVHTIMYTIIPAGIAVHIPLKLFKNFQIPQMIIVICGTVLYCLISVWFFYHGLRKYESGNMIVTRT